MVILLWKIIMLLFYIIYPKKNQNYPSSSRCSARLPCLSLKEKKEKFIEVVKFSLCNIYIYLLNKLKFSSLVIYIIMSEQITQEQEEEISPKKTIDTMNFEELKAYTKKIQDNKRKYIRKYQKTDRGKATTRIASQKYYKKKRQEILEKKKIYYLKKKQLTA